MHENCHGELTLEDPTATNVWQCPRDAASTNASESKVPTPYVSVTRLVCKHDEQCYPMQKAGAHQVRRLDLPATAAQGLEPGHWVLHSSDIPTGEWVALRLKGLRCTSHSSGRSSIRLCQRVGPGVRYPVHPLLRVRLRRRGREREKERVELGNLACRRPKVALKTNV